MYISSEHVERGAGGLDRGVVIIDVEHARYSEPSFT
jgi:hypothetical protein